MGSDSGEAVNIDFSTFWINKHLDQVDGFISQTENQGLCSKQVYNSLHSKDIKWRDVRCLMLAKLLIEEMENRERGEPIEEA